MLKEKIVVRIDADARKIIENFVENKASGISRFIRSLILNYTKDRGLKEKIDLKLKQEIKDYLMKKKGLKLKQKQKEKLFMYYLISNTIKSIYKLSSSFLINSGELNMVIVNKVVNGAIEIYNNYPEDIKNDLKSEIKSLEELKNEEVLIGKMKMLKLISQQKQVNGGHK